MINQLNEIYLDEKYLKYAFFILIISFRANCNYYERKAKESFKR